MQFLWSQSYDTAVAAIRAALYLVDTNAMPSVICIVLDTTSTTHTTETHRYTERKKNERQLKMEKIKCKRITTNKKDMKHNNRSNNKMLPKIISLHTCYMAKTPKEWKKITPSLRQDGYAIRNIIRNEGREVPRDPETPRKQKQTASSILRCVVSGYDRVCMRWRHDVKHQPLLSRLPYPLHTYNMNIDLMWISNMRFRFNDTYVCMHEYILVLLS